MVRGHGPLRRPARGRGRRRRRRRAGRLRRRPDRHRLAPAHPRVVHARRRPHPHDTRLLPAEGVPGQRHGHRVGRHRRRVRPHVLVVRRQGHARRVAPAGAAGQGSRGRRRARGGLPAPRRAAAQGRPGDGDRTRPATTDGVVVRCDDGRVVRSTHAVLAIGSVPNSDGLDLDAAGVETDAGGYIPIDHNCVTNVRTSTPPATSAASCRCRRWRRCRAARSPSG